MRPGSPFALPTSLRSIVFTTQSVVILEWAEKVRAGQAVTFGLERAIVDRLGLLDLAERPRADAIGRGDADLDLVEGLGLRGLIGEGGQFVHGYEPLSNLFSSPIGRGDRKSVVSGKSVSVRVDLGGRGIIKKKKKSRKALR